MLPYEALWEQPTVNCRPVTLEECDIQQSLFCLYCQWLCDYLFAIVRSRTAWHRLLWSQVWCQGSFAHLSGWFGHSMWGLYRPHQGSIYCLYFHCGPQDCTSSILAPQTNSLKWLVNSCLAESQNVKYLSIPNVWLAEWTLSGYKTSSGFLLTVAKTL